MNDLPELSGPSLPPAEDAKPEQLVILLHGVGADGNDLIGLAPHFQQVLPGALFVSPNAPFPFDMMPMGYQWFGIQDFSLAARLAGAQRAAPILDAFIDAQLARHGLGEEQMALVGFSQGAMMALYVGLRRARPARAIISYSGMIVGHEQLAREIRSRPPVLLTHGTADTVLPFACLADAEQALRTLGLDIQVHQRPGLGHGIDDACIRLGQLFLADAFGVPVP